MAVIACVSLGFYTWAVKSGFETEYLQEANKLNEEIRVKDGAMTADSNEKAVM